MKPRQTLGCLRADGGGGPLTVKGESGDKLMVASSGDCGELNVLIIH